MAISYTFLIDNNNFGDPNGWQELAIAYSFKDNLIREDFTFTLEYCENSNTGSYPFFEALAADPCGSTEFIINRFCNGAFEDQHATGTIRTKDLAFDCNKKSVTITIENDTGLKRLEEGQGDEVCANSNNCIPLFQYESGGDYLNADLSQTERCGVNIADMLTEFESAFDATFSNIPLFTAPNYQPEINQITIPAIAAGNTITLLITSSLGSTFNVTVVAGGADTSTTIAEKIANGLLCKDVTATGYTMNELEVVHRVDCAENTGAVIDLTTDWEVESIDLFLNGAPQVGAIVQTQPFIYSLSGLSILPKGMSDGELCLNWQQIKELFISLFNGVIADTPTGISIDTYENTFNTSASISASERRLVKTFDEDELNKRGRFGSEFELKNVFESQQNWEWVASGPNQSLNPTLPPLSAAIPATSTGLAKLDGNVCVINATGGDITFTLEILLNGVKVVESTIGAPLNDTLCFDINDLFTTPDANKFCLTSGVDVFTTNIPGGLPPGVTFDLVLGDFYIAYGRPCFDQPQANEQTSGTPTYNPFNDLLGCTSTLDKGISSDFYTGLGFAISQQIEGLYDYDETFFAILQDPISLDAQQFRRCLFFAPNDADMPADCVCLSGEVVEHYYYNMLLQRPHILKFYQQSVPSDIEIDAFEFTTSIDADGNYTCNQNQVVISQVKENDDLCLYSFGYCISPNDWNTLKTERKILHNNCNGQQVEGIIKRMESHLKGRITNVIVKG